MSQQDQKTQKSSQQTAPKDADTTKDKPGSEEQKRIHELEGRLQEFEEIEKQKQLEGLSAEQQRIKELEEKLKDQASKPLLESKYFKESELRKYTADQVQAMNDLLQKVRNQGQPARGAKPPVIEKKEPIGRWFNSKTGKWTA